jgi:hypothetical protein
MMPLTLRTHRTVLAFFDTVPVSVRADVGRRLFDAWVNPAAAGQQPNEQRRKVAWARFGLENLV